MISISLSFKRLSDSAFDVFSNRVHLLMSKDAQFDSLTAEVAKLKVDYDSFSLALAIATGRATLAIKERNDKRDVLITRLLIIAKLVEIMAGDDENVAIAAGFELRKKSESIDKITPPTNFTAVNDDVSTAVLLKWKAGEGALQYAVKHRVKGETEWKNGSYTTSCSIVLSGFELGSYVEFCVCSTGRKEMKSDYTAPMGVWID
jgi:hypothetical protein